jgi:nucleotide-binding universal stress UspA family protein
MAGTIVAYIGEGPSYWPLAERAAELAASRKSRLIFYDVDAASAFSNPLPTVWSAEGEAEQFGDRLDPEQLDKAGRPELRDRVARARDEGVDAWGWLPSKRDAKELAEYAAKQNATLLVIPSTLEQKGLADWLKGRPSADEVVEEADQPVLVVDLEPEAAKA